MTEPTLMPVSEPTTETPTTATTPLMPTTPAVQSADGTNVAKVDTTKQTAPAEAKTSDAQTVVAPTNTATTAKLTEAAVDSTGTDAGEAVAGYKPVFNNIVRTIIYVLSLIGQVVGAYFFKFGSVDLGMYIVGVCGFISSAFGVAYNPLRLASK